MNTIADVIMIAAGSAVQSINMTGEQTHLPNQTVLRRVISSASLTFVNSPLSPMRGQ